MDDLTFRIQIQKLLVDEESYWSKYAWCNNITGNDIVFRQFRKRIRMHPILWRLFFKLR